MDKKEAAKEFSNATIYELNEMLTLINDQTQQIDYLHDKLDDVTTQCNGRIMTLEEQIVDLNEYPNCPTEDIEFDGEDDFCNR